MSTATNVGTTITSVLTVGVGGVVLYVKKNLGAILKSASQVRDLATKDIEQIKVDIEEIKSAVIKPVAKKAPAKKAATKRVVGK